MTTTALALASEAAIVAHGATESDSVGSALITLAIVGCLVAAGALAARLTSQKDDDAIEQASADSIGSALEEDQNPG